MNVYTALKTVATGTNTPAFADRDLVERNASVVLRTGMAQIRDSPCRHVGIATWGLGLGSTSKIADVRPPLNPWV